MSWNTNAISTNLNSQFKLNNSALISYIQEVGKDKALMTEWNDVENVYSVSNHYNQVCDYMNNQWFSSSVKAEIGAKVKGFAVTRIVKFINEFEEEPVKVKSKPVIKSKKSKTRNDWKGRALKAEAELRECKSVLRDTKDSSDKELAKREETIYELINTNELLLEANNSLVKAVQSKLNNIKTQYSVQQQSV